MREVKQLLSCWGGGGVRKGGGEKGVSSQFCKCCVVEEVSGDFMQVQHMFKFVDMDNAQFGVCCRTTLH